MHLRTQKDLMLFLCRYNNSMVKAASVKQQSYLLPLKGIKAVAVVLLVFCKTKKTS